MNKITGNKIGTKVNLFINGVLHSKECGVKEAADLFFTEILKTMKDPTDENVEGLYEFLNKNIRIAKMAGFEYDVTTDETVYADVERGSTSEATITFAATPTNSVRVLVQKIG